MRNTIILIGIISLSFLSIGCSSQFGLKTLLPWYEANQVETIEIVSSINANRNSAVSVDVVLIYDESLAGELKKMSARDWFKRKSEIHLNYPSGVDIMSWEIVPASSIVSGGLPKKSRFAKNVLLFAFFANSDNPHRTDITQLKKVKVYLEEIGFRLEQGTE